MTDYDVVIVGGGVLGTSAAIQFAYRGLRVALVEMRNSLCMEASGRNAGGLPIQIQKPSLIPFAVAAMDYWQGRVAPFKANFEYHRIGSLAVAITESDEQVINDLNAKRVALGAEIHNVTRQQALELEPELSADIRMASYCPADGHVNPLIGGKIFEALARENGVQIHLGSKVDLIERTESGYVVTVGERQLRGKRIVLATGAWLEEGLRHFGIDTRLTVRINQMAITERAHWSMKRYITVAAGNLSVKQLTPGTIAIGGGWQGQGALEPEWSQLDFDNFIGNLRLAARVVPRLRSLRIARTWTGFDVRNDAFDPLLGEIPGHPDAYVFGGVFCGWHLGPCIASTLVDTILGYPTALSLPAGAIGQPIASGTTACELSHNNL
ncbi:NAD(P)/FAD-dependent oxidoreductase [Pseudomonas putida]|uniref:NAD(P)/FAD-dependent oxidoreductase n=1 Tax=Pseudomonas putida TaxID=303 RepID=UPI003F2A917C